LRECEYLSNYKGVNSKSIWDEAEETHHLLNNKQAYAHSM